MKLLVCYPFTKEQLKKIEGMGFELYLLQNERGPCPEEYMDAEAVICYQLFNYNDISKFKNLRLIQTTSAGLDHMPMEYILSHGISLYNAGGVFSAPMAEFALCGVLQLYKHAPAFARKQRGHVWRQDRGLLELGGKRVCIVGAGSIGSENAKRFSAMGCYVTGLCRRPTPRQYFDEMRSIDELDKVLRLSDIVILSLPLSEHTRGMFDAERFEEMKDGAVFVNIARGPIVDTQALLHAIDSGKLLGAVIDVCETEPLPQDSPLWDKENIILTPHNSFVGDGNVERMFKLTCKDFKDYFEHFDRREI